MFISGIHYHRGINDFLSQREKFNAARFELHQLLSQSSLAGVPLLVLGNKNDLEDHAPIKELIPALYVSGMRMY